VKFFEDCPLCKSKDTAEFAAVSATRIFYLCIHCDLRFLRSDLRLNSKEEKERYDFHQNDVEDKHYRAFVSPLVNAVEEKLFPGAHGLDFGCGPGPVASHILREKGFAMDLYDPYFQPKMDDLKDRYDFIICCEVMEHFFDPLKEIKFLRERIHKGGFLFAMTQLWRNQIPFENWTYQRDLTHVCFYSEETFRWIQEEYSFQQMEICSDNLIALSC